MHPVAMVNLRTKSNLVRKGFIHLTASSLSLREVRAGAQGRNPEAEIEIKT